MKNKRSAHLGDIQFSVAPADYDLFYVFRLSLGKEAISELAEKISAGVIADVEKEDINSVGRYIVAALQDYGWAPKIYGSNHNEFTGIVRIMAAHEKATIDQVANALENAWYRVCNGTVGFTKARRDFNKSCDNVTGRKKKLAPALHLQRNDNPRIIESLKQQLLTKDTTSTSFISPAPLRK